MVKRSAFAGCLAFYNKATPSVTTPKPASDAVTAPSRRRLKCCDSFRPFGAPSRAVEPALGQETARSMCRFQVRKWSKPHRGFAKNALAHPSAREPMDTMKLIAAKEMQARQGARGFAAGVYRAPAKILLLQKICGKRRSRHKKQCVCRWRTHAKLALLRRVSDQGKTQARHRIAPHILRGSLTFRT